MKQFVLFLVLFMSGCAVHKAEFNVPKSVDFNGTKYVQTTANQIDTMQQYLYLAENSSRDPNHWQQGLIFFLDQTAQSLQERITFRQKHFATLPNTVFQIETVGNELRSELIYPPTERFNDVQLEVTRGQNSSCGYSQMQFSDKRSVSAKNPQDLSAYRFAVKQLAEDFAQLPWQITCQ